jgi:hypothetical protein
VGINQKGINKKLIPIGKKKVLINGNKPARVLN